MEREEPWDRPEPSPRYEGVHQRHHGMPPPRQEMRELPMQPACWTYWHWLMFVAYTAMVRVTVTAAACDVPLLLQLIGMAVQYQRVGILVLLMAIVPTLVVFVVFW